MRKLSYNFKWCTCETDIKHLHHCWVLHRVKPKASENEIVVSMTDLLVFPEEEIALHHETLLLNLLNNTQVFDAPLKFNSKAPLQLSFSLNSGVYLKYCFEFNGKTQENLE